jgi:hypothetical protein
MATLNASILAAAHADRLLPSPLTTSQSLYLHPTVVTANKIYWAIADSGDRGLDLLQLQQVTGIHYNTLTQFCRWMVEQSLLYIETEGEVQHRPANIYYAYLDAS